MSTFLGCKAIPYLIKALTPHWEYENSTLIMVFVLLFASILSLCCKKAIYIEGDPQQEEYYNFIPINGRRKTISILDTLRTPGIIISCLMVTMITIMCLTYEIGFMSYCSRFKFHKHTITTLYYPHYFGVFLGSLTFGMILDKA
jgi:hypothetical protein